MKGSFIRKQPARRRIDDDSSNLVIQYLTICTDHRKPILARKEAVDLILNSWEDHSAYSVGRYVIMPDHIHFFSSKRMDSPNDLSSWMKFWKSRVSRQWPWKQEQPLWQRNFWDRSLRTDECYAVKWEYVRLNPVRHGLATSPDQWPFQGELNILE